MKLESVSIKNSQALTEKWVQDQIASDPSILGLGDLLLRDRERLHASAGRLDLLLQEPETLKRYEVEIQLGATDESHIIRTVEYWDIERKRYPQYEHAAVIVAEDITSRFLNVIQLFNGAIPLIALKMTAYKVGAEHALTFVKVLDELAYGLVDADEPIAEPTDRAFWEQRGSGSSIATMDALLKLVHELEPRAALKYNKHYVGLTVEGVAKNFVSFMPRRAHVILSVKLPQTAETDQRIEGAGLDLLRYDTGFRRYLIRLASMPQDNQRKVLLDLIRQAHESRM